MHKVQIPKAVTERIIARMGKPHSCDTLERERTALVVVDMQNYFMMESQQAACPVAREIVPNVNRLAQAVRASGGLVVWLKMLASEESRQSWSAYQDRVLPEWRERRFRELGEDGSGFELWSGLDVADSDAILIKTRYSAFTRGSSKLEEVLLVHGIDTVLITGVATNTCCESTGRDAMQLNFRTVMVSDGCAAKTDDAHNATLANFYNSFGDVRETVGLIELLQAAGKSAAAE